jgi:hypothetical protein
MQLTCVTLFPQRASEFSPGAQMFEQEAGDRKFLKRL